MNIETVKSNLPLFRLGETAATPGALAAAMSFPKDYQFTGNREAQVKQIGNSVAVGVAKALCLEILKGVRK